jgi:tetratricopeptide (TPR) repeat protein
MPRAPSALLLESLAASALLCLVALYAAHPIFSVDFHWHLALGDLIRTTGEIPQTDTFSAVHPDRPYVQFNWLWDATASRIHHAFGLVGIRLFQALALTASFGVLYFALRLTLASAPAALLLTALGLVLFEDRFRARPDALSLGFMAAMLPLLLGGYRRAGRTAVLVVFMLGLLWSNLHGGASLLLVLSMGALVAGTLGERVLLGRRPPDPSTEPGAPLPPIVRAAVLLVAATVGVMLSPTLIPGLMHWVQAVTPQIQIGNEEWMPSYTILRHGVTPAHLIVGLGPTLVAIVYVGDLVARLRRQGASALDLPEQLLAGGYLILAHQAVRNSFLCLLPATFLLARVARALPSAPPARARHVSRGLFVGAALLAAVSFQDAVLQGYGSLERAARLFPYDLLPGTYPTLAAEFMQEAELEGGVMNDGRWGGYLIHRLYPRVGVFVDTRHDLVGPMWRVFNLTHNPVTRPLGLEEGFQRYGMELAVFDGPTFPLIEPTRGWVLLYKAGDQEVYQHRAGAHAADNFRRARDWFQKRGAPLTVLPTDPGYAPLVTRLGAMAYLRGPLLRERLRLAERNMNSGDPRERARGLRIRGKVMLEAGDYRAALSDYGRATELDSEDPRAPHYAALCALQLGDLERARAALQTVRGRDLSRLRPDDRQRLALLEARLQ